MNIDARSSAFPSNMIPAAPKIFFAASSYGGPGCGQVFECFSNFHDGLSLGALLWSGFPGTSGVPGLRAAG